MWCAGLLLAQVLQPYLAFLNKQTLSENKVLDSLLKVVVDQLTMSPLLCALFLAYLKATEAPPPLHAHTPRARAWTRGLSR